MRKLTYIIVACFALLSCETKEEHSLTIKLDGDVISIDGTIMELHDIQDAIYIKRQSLDSIQNAQFFIKLEITSDTQMGIVSDVKQELRKADALNVRFFQN
mgnify:CR=1 FL=1